jgi:hypothetical protein
MTELEHNSVPMPDLRIVPTQSLHPHEEHDSQRSQPLVERLRSEQVMINPPLVAPIDDENYVILDGANRVYAFGELGYPHMLVQVATYDSGLCELSNWQHVVSDWNIDQFIQKLREIPVLSLHEGKASASIAELHLRDDRLIALCTSADTTAARNAALRQVVAVYQRNARLHRTALTDPAEVWAMFPEAVALVTFPPYSPDDIITAARECAFLPPGISRHIVHGRAIRVNYPLDRLRDLTVPLARKNADLLAWLHNKLANRQVRYYAEATYQFDE